MAGGSSSLTFRLFGEDVSASRTLDKVGVQAETLGSKFTRAGEMAGKALAGITVAVGAVGAASVKLAMDFDQQMTRISTQAHVPQAALKQLSAGVLDLAGEVGIGPTSLAEALYHIESSFASTGITGKKAMDILKVAAEGARIGGADLVDVTNAMDAAVVSGIKGVENYNEAMGRLNATVGAGDMSMQDLADALGTGMLAVVKGFGVTLNDVSAGLATFGDNNMRGALAGNQLRMSVQALVKPSKDGVEMLQSLGTSAHDLAVDMQQGGLNKALTDLKDRLDKAGITGSKVGEFLTDAFGRKAGTGLNILIGQFDRFESKFEEADKGAHQFTQDWQQQQQQFSQVLKQLEAGAEAVGIRIGNFLIPKIMQFGKAVADAWHNLNQQAGGQQSILKEFMTGFNNPAMTNFDSGFGGALEKIGVSAKHLGDSLSRNLKPVFHDVWDFIKNSLLPALGNLWTVLDPVIHRALNDLGQAFHDLGEFIKNDAGPWLKNITQWMADHKQAVQDFATVVGVMFTAWAGYKVWNQANTSAQALTKSIATLKAAATTPAGKFGLLAGLSLGFYELYQSFEIVRKGVLLAAADVITAVNGIVVAVKAMGDFTASVILGMVDLFARLPGPLGAPWRAAKHAVQDFKSTWDKNFESAIQTLDRTNDHLYDLRNGITKTTVSADDLKRSVEGIPNRTIIVSVIDHAKDILNDIHNAAAGLINLGFTPQEATNTIKAGNIADRADGGLIVGPGGPRDDKAGIFRLSNGEAVVPAHLVPKYAGAFARDGIPGFANGGLVDRLTYDATPTVQEMGRILNSGGGFGVPGGSGPVGGSVSRWLGVVLQALALNGASAMWAPRVLSQIQFESGGNPNAHQTVIDINTFNGSGGAQGLLQVLFGTFLANHIPGTSMNIFDPLANVAAGIHHAIHEDPGGLSYLGQGHGYALGGFARGWARVGEAGPELVYLGRGAHVVSNRDSSMGGGQVIVNITGPVYSDSAGIKRLMSEIDREVSRGGSVPATFRR